MNEGLSFSFYDIERGVCGYLIHFHKYNTQFYITTRTWS